MIPFDLGGRKHLSDLPPKNTALKKTLTNVPPISSIYWDITISLVAIFALVITWNNFFDWIEQDFITIRQFALKYQIGLELMTIFRTKELCEYAS